jgi:4-hydroxythreonine-4-phosphate dehydrogenase
MTRIGLTLGDPCGIGPELWVKTLLRLRTEQPDAMTQLTMYGDPLVLQQAATQLGRQREWQTASADLLLIPITMLSTREVPPGQPSSLSGTAQVSYLRAAIADAQAGVIQGICTGPIHKASAKAAGLMFPGHTELLADTLLAPNRSVVMMLAGPTLRVALCSIHIALAHVPAVLTSSGIAQTLVTTALGLADDFGDPSPQLAVLGLNPHAGEAGHFGDEEARIIIPAMEAARKDARLAALPGVGILGPLVPDVAFRQALYPSAGSSRPSALIAMYHDQGLIPIKLIDFDHTVNVTLGLRVVRTSPDHGTAHDIAGKGIAREDSLHAALTMCLAHTARRFGKCKQTHSARATML